MPPRSREPSLPTRCGEHSQTYSSPTWSFREGEKWTRGGGIACNQHHPGLPTIFMSGHTRDTVVHDGRLDEGIEFLEKPFTPDTLLQKVRLVSEPPPDRKSAGIT